LKDTVIVFLTAAVRQHQIEDHEGIICDLPCVAKPSSVEEIVQCIDANISHQGRPHPGLPTE
jgi:hypothetical protein